MCRPSARASALFSAHAEVIPIHYSDFTQQNPLLRACGGNSEGGRKAVMGRDSSPRMRR